MFNPDELINVLPRRSIELDRHAKVPKARSVGECPSYNGFTGKERLRTAAIAKWLVSQNAILSPQACGLCERQTHHFHAENYYDLASWIDICRGCHARLHNRFRHAEKWREWLKSLAVPTAHWAWHISSEPTDLAAFLRDRGQVEPTYESLIRAVDNPI